MYIIIILRIGIYFIFNYVKSHTDDKAYLSRLESYQHFYFLGAIIPILMAMWGEIESIKTLPRMKQICIDLVVKKKL